MRCFLLKPAGNMRQPG